LGDQCFVPTCSKSFLERQRECRFKNLLKDILVEPQKPYSVSYNSNTSDISAIERKATLMPIPEDRLETVEHTLNKAYGEITRELAVVREFTEDSSKRLASQKITLDEHAQILRDHTARLDRIETMLAQILTHLKNISSAIPTNQERSDPEPMQPGPAPRRERTFFERMMGIFPEETETEMP
jgi:hypothetical protein